MAYTHFLAVWASQDIEKLYRADTGISVAERQGVVAIYGSEPNRRKSHVFYDPAFAAKWLRETYPAMDLKEQGVEGEPSVDVRNIDADCLVIMPPDTMRIADLTAGVRPIKN